jgi:hypothetical protein
VQGFKALYYVTDTRPRLPDCTPPELNLYADCDTTPLEETYISNNGSVTRGGHYDTCTHVTYDIRSESGGELMLKFDNVYLNYYWSTFLYVYVCEDDLETCPLRATVTGRKLPDCYHLSAPGRFKIEFRTLDNETFAEYGDTPPWGNFTFSWNVSSTSQGGGGGGGDVAVNETSTSASKICQGIRTHNVTEPNGTIEHVFPATRGYPNNKEDTWIIMPPPEGEPIASVLLEFVAFETESGFDYLYIYGCQDAEGKCELVRMLSGNEQPCSITVNAPVVKVTFISDPYFAMRGFHIRYTTSGTASDNPTVCEHDLLCPEAGNAGEKLLAPKLRWETLCCKKEAKNAKYKGHFWGTYDMQPGEGAADAYVVYTAGTAEGSLDCSDSESELNMIYHNTTLTEVYNLDDYLPGELSWMNYDVSPSAKYNSKFGLVQKVWVNGSTNSYGPLPAPEINKNGSSTKLFITAATCVPMWHPFGTKWITSTKVLKKVIPFVSPPSIVVTATIPFVQPDFYNLTGTQAELTNLTVSEDRDNMRPSVIMYRAVLGSLSLGETPWRAVIKKVTIKVSAHTCMFPSRCPRMYVFVYVMPTGWVNLWLYIHTYIYIYTFVCVIYIYIYIYIYTYIHTYIHTYTHTHTSNSCRKWVWRPKRGTHYGKTRVMCLREEPLCWG